MTFTSIIPPQKLRISPTLKFCFNKSGWGGGTLYATAGFADEGGLCSVPGVRNYQWRRNSS